MAHPLKAHALERGLRRLHGAGDFDPVCMISPSRIIPSFSRKRSGGVGRDGPGQRFGLHLGQDLSLGFEPVLAVQSIQAAALLIELVSPAGDQLVKSPIIQKRKLRARRALCLFRLVILSHGDLLVWRRPLGGPPRICVSRSPGRSR